MIINNNRSSQRFPLVIPVDLIFGTQITLKGQVKDLSLKSAFINVRSSISMDTHDELEFSITGIPNNADAAIKGIARISRVSPGEGIAIYFTKMDDTSTAHLKQLVSACE